MLSRPPSSPRIAIAKPPPSVPSRADAGTRTPSKFTIAVGWQLHPIFLSGFPKDRPGLPEGTIKQEMPFGPAAPVRHMIRYTSLRPAPEMNAFAPDST